MHTGLSAETRKIIVVRYKEPQLKLKMEMIEWIPPDSIVFFLLDGDPQHIASSAPHPSPWISSYSGNEFMHLMTKLTPPDIAMAKQSMFSLCSLAQQL